jgi:hypothetical protein
VNATAAHRELHPLLCELGKSWAASPQRPRIHREVLLSFDEVLQRWLASDLPLILRDGGRRGKVFQHVSGRDLFFGDNSPANWSFALALAGAVPDLAAISRETLHERVPLTFTSRGEAAKRDLNKAGWKICHIAPVSDRQRVKPEVSPLDRVGQAFLRFLSPRNMFLIPKVIAGAGELPEVVGAIAEFDGRDD